MNINNNIINSDKVYEFVANALESSRDGYPICILSDDDTLVNKISELLKPLADKYVEANSGNGIIRLDSSGEKHIYKRVLNQYDCELLLYTDEYEPVVWEILNDGSTLLQHTLKVE